MPALSRWIIATNHGDAIRARFVAMANGYLQKPKLPGIDGITAFRGTRFTPAGGTTTTPAPIWPSSQTSGSASSAPAPPPSSACRIWRGPSKHLLVFQRTPSTVDVRGNRPTDPAWSADCEDGWQRRRIENFQLLTAGGDADEDLVNDAWTSIVKKLFVMRQTARRGHVRRRPFARSGYGRLRQDGGDPRPRRFDRGRTRQRRRPQTLVRLLLQATMLSRRVSANVQPRQRDSRRHPG